MAPAPKRIVDCLSRERLALWAGSGPGASGRELLAQRLLTALDSPEPEPAVESILAEVSARFFYNLTASAKRRAFDAIAVALTDNEADADALFALFKQKKWTGRTKST